MSFLLKLRTSTHLLRGTAKTPPRRHGSLAYRDFPKPPVYIQRMATGAMGIAWFWLMWRFYHDPGDVLGHYPYPNAKNWTDEELGIPPDDED